MTNGPLSEPDNTQEPGMEQAATDDDQRTQLVADVEQARSALMAAEDALETYDNSTG